MAGPRARGELPSLVRGLLRPAPRLPLALFLTLAARRLVRRRPELIDRLGATARVPVAIIPTDIPFAFRIVLDGERTRVDVIGLDEASRAAARVIGPLFILLGLLDGTYDGDAVFFSRDIVIEGDTEHVLALRNTLEEAELTPADFAGITGSAADFINRGSADALARIRRMLGAPPASA